MTNMIIFEKLIIVFVIACIALIAWNSYTMSQRISAVNDSIADVSYELRAMQYAN